MKLQIYLDTSVFSAYYDDRTPDRQLQTQDFWERLKEFNTSTSELAYQELMQTENPQLKIKLLELLNDITIHPLTDEMKKLAHDYIDIGVFNLLSFNDALHVSVAVLTGQNILLSWNFKHLVNRRRRAKINEFNISMGLPNIEIIAPPEL